ncbi:MAG TPA: glycoside hydrolase domain-containing protein [Candidatus Acidoferrum sp.]|nr:glycoside hydrolase domain-containing protein [Candidatus Acidoferrum sp.]
MRTFAALLLSLLFLPGVCSAGAAPDKFFLGFDRNDYPGDDAMKILRKNFAFTSYWLGNPPGEKTNSWSGKRSILQSQGWGFLPLFNGPTSKQLQDDASALRRAAKDAAAVVAAARREGFPAGTVIFLDIEEGGRLPSTYSTYLKQWITDLTAAGFRAGVYCSGIPVDEGAGHSIITADFIREQIKPLQLVNWVFNDSCPPSPGCVTPQELPAPSKSGIAYAEVWQFVRSPRDKETGRHCRGYAKDGNCYAAFDTAHKYHLDLNVATSPNPSAPR